MKKLLPLLLVVFILAWSCRKDTLLPKPYKPTPIRLKVPARFPAPYLSADNPLTTEGVRLGRMLYYDSILSSNGQSCNSCHFRDRSFSSPLFHTKTGERISVPPHVNLAWNPDYNWNGSEPVLDRLCLGDFGPDFFNTHMPDLVEKLTHHPKYPQYFKEAFDVNDIRKLSDAELQLKVVYSISQFMRTMVSSDSRFDKMMRHEINLTPEETDGMQTFFTERGDCFHCHGYPLFTSNTYNNTGLDSIPTGGDLGRYLVSKNIFDKGKFSVPTLRNIALTGPYMHDGRYATLEEVVEFYNSGVHQGAANIDPLMTKSFKKSGLHLTQSQQMNLVKFLNTLTDTLFINNPDFKNPL